MDVFFWYLFEILQKYLYKYTNMFSNINRFYKIQWVTFKG